LQKFFKHDNRNQILVYYFNYRFWDQHQTLILFTCFSKKCPKSNLDTTFIKKKLLLCLLSASEIFIRCFILVKWKSERSSFWFRSENWCTLVNTNHWKPNVNNYLRHWIILSMLDTNHQLRLSRKHFKYKGTFISPPVNIKLQFCTFSSDQCVIIIKATLHISFIIEKILAVLCVCNYIT